ncbi:methyltransferase domain-containing protein [Parvularcula maris]|uniref:Methyltransferase domain-containing protein n=1 Tax=Parvularcula maris TaxID=2965077 RepID=A0A9X2LAX4_9PROT|nr:methyltransferase domain-containing protein [Parvularcula maris]
MEDNDQVDEHIAAKNARWSFGGSVPTHFESHIEKSVPGYRHGHETVARLSDFFLTDGSQVYEIGSSTGALSRRIIDWNDGKRVKLTGIEIEPAMVEQARELSSGYDQITYEEGDALSFPFEPADLIVAYYTVQFIRPAVRQQLFDKIYESLNWGGAFILFEKVRGPDARFQDILTTLYTDFKLSNGLSEKEIVQKTRSLKGVLEPFSSQGNRDMLTRAGFVDTMTVFRDLSFEGTLSIK